MADRSIIKIPKPPDLEELLLSLDTECDSEELGTKPAWFEVAEKRASESGQTVDELLIADRKRLRESNYPGPECFEPHELELYVNGKLSSERIAHTKNCPSCTGLLRVALPSDALLGKLVGEIQKLAQVIAEDPDHATQTQLALNRAWLSNVIQCLPTGKWVAPAIIICGAVAGVNVALGIFYLRATVPFTDQIFEAAYLALKPMLLLMGAGLVALSWSVIGRRRLAVPIGTLLALVLSAYTLSQLRKTDLEFSVLQDRLGQVVAKSLSTYHIMGEFPRAEEYPGLVDVYTSANDANTATYSASLPGLPGRITAEVSLDSGTFHWRPSAKKSELFANLIFGKVTSVTPKIIQLSGKSGVIHQIKVVHEWPAHLKGEDVIAVVEPDSQMLLSLHPTTGLRIRN